MRKSVALSVSAVACMVVGTMVSCAGGGGGGGGKSSISAVPSAPAPGLRETAPDVNFLQQYGATNRFRMGRPTGITIAPGGGTVWFLRSGPRSFEQDLYEFDTATGEERLALSAQRLLGGGEEQLSVEELARRERMRMSSRGITGYSRSEDGRRLLVPLSGRLFVVETSDWSVRELTKAGGTPIDARFSEDGTMVACVREGELYAIEVESGVQRRLTNDAGEGVTNGLAEFVAQEEMARSQGYWWSPDGSMIAFEQADTGGMEVFHIGDAYRPEKGPTEWAYPRAGMKNAVVRLGIVSSRGGGGGGGGGGVVTWVSWDRERYPYLATVKWGGEGEGGSNGPLLVVVQNRRQTEELVLEVDSESGSTRRLLEERDEAWVNLFQETPRWLKDGSGFLWMTERNGAPELEVRGPDGSFVRRVAGAGEGLVGLLAVDEDREGGGVVYVVGSEEPTQRHVWRAPLAESGGRAKRMTSEPGVHSAVFAEDGSAWVEISSLLSGREGTRWSVVRGDGSRTGEIRSVAERASFEAKPELVTVRANGRDLRAAVVRPRGFRDGVKYPVIASVYGGPHTQMVMASRDSYMLNQWIADHGYIVVSVDGRGTPARGRAWERAIKGNLIDPALEDLVGGLAALGSRFREMDMERVGVFGWSFGGYFSAMATMRRPDVFKAGVAGAPVCDWRDYDTHYTERYLGLPEESAGAYEVSSVLGYCDELRAPLLIIHGTADDNVYLVNGLKMADALFRAGKRFDFLPLAGATHMVREPAMIERMYGRIMDHFDAALRP